MGALFFVAFVGKYQTFATRIFETDSFIENYDGDMMVVKPDIFGMYEMGVDMRWVLA